MDADAIHLCPHCELRFASTVEWRDHIDHEHHSAEPTPPPVATGRLAVAVDPSHLPGEEVVIAAALAAQSGQGLDLVAVPPSGLGRNEADAFLRARVHEVREAGVDTVAWTVLASTDPATAVLDHAAQSGATTIALRSRARSAVRELLLGSVSEGVLRRAAVPVLLIGPNAERPDGPYRRVVAAVDGTPASAAVVAAAGELADALGIAVEEFRAVPEGWVDEGFDRLTQPPSLGGEAAALAVLGELHGDPRTVAVVGTEGRRGFDRVLFESVAVSVVRNAHGPVLVIPPTLCASADDTPPVVAED
jgi:nucleotide-binding universal stress UspA family protein